ncbi:MAG: PD-(D/E)XK nuclease family protein [Gammaproteobacteria bacterium]|nr:PD-(D/E)XK nuclease family protein [Gammaproteobacteria bacterium]MBU1732792.1 PD-(D/E)XK nuclease family protein [Gammaproteobacteria bacterium]MBU1891617.1 PD-(D/E)XK nuclease family protein [Gammaproteobacteria bacterium]
MSSLNNYAFAPDQLLAAAAREVIALERSRLPNLSSLTVLLPSLHAAGNFGRALSEAAGGITLLLPRFATLRDLAGQADPGLARVPLSRRQAAIYQALRAREWFRQGDLWHVSAELLRLFDEITLWQVQLPASSEDFLQQLEAAYQAQRGNPMQFEARLVHELWFAMSGSGELDDAAHYQMQLSQLAGEAAGPLYLVGLNALMPVEQAFLERYAQFQPVHAFISDGRQDSPAGLAYLLDTAWADPDQAVPLHARAAACLSEAPASGLGQRVSLFGAHGLEHEAEVLAFRVGQWLAQGKSAIAVIVQDRLVARRARALLERAEVLVQDETGWTLSTTSASTVLMRWLDNLDSQFHFQDLLDLLKSPFIFSAWDAGRRRNAVYRLEQLIRKHSVVSHLNHYRALAGEDEDILELLQMLYEAQQILDKKKQRPLSAWLHSLQESLERLEIRPGLQRDQAGEQVLRLLDGLLHELTPDTTPFRYAEWRQWLNQQLEAAVFRDDSITSPVVFTHLAACRLRHFDAAIIAGADATHLPGQGRESVFFNQAVRTQLGLPDRRTALASERQDLISLLSSVPEVWVTWQARRNGEPNPLSPWFERLETFHVLAYGLSLRGAEAISSQMLAAEKQDGFAALAMTGRPAPSLPPALVPETVSASGYNSLMACPYQFFARHALHLNELDEVAQALEKRDYGEYVHDILHRFHSRYPVVADGEPGVQEQALREISKAVFDHAIEADFVSHAWLSRWEASIPGYLAWQRKRECEGWRWLAGELASTRQIALMGGGSLTLRGRLDRVDAKGAEQAVLDYKTQSLDNLKKKLKPAGEDVQLACYALLLETLPRQAAFVAVDEEVVQQVEPVEPLAELAEANLERLQIMFQSLHEGEPLPAQGVSAACQYCEMRGLCRKDYWNE